MTRRPAIIPPPWSVLTAEQAAAMIARHEARQRHAVRIQRLKAVLAPVRLMLALSLLAWSLGLF